MKATPRFHVSKGPAYGPTLPLDERSDRWMRRTFGYVDHGLGWSMIRLNIAAVDARRSLVARIRATRAAEPGIAGAGDPYGESPDAPAADE